VNSRTDAAKFHRRDLAGVNAINPDICSIGKRRDDDFMAIVNHVHVLRPQSRWNTEQTKGDSNDCKPKHPTRLGHGNPP
jgi:hypothetical protein